MRTLLVPPPLVAGFLRIEGDEAHHGRTVLRLVAGDQVRLADGDGRSALATLRSVERHHLEAEAEAPTPVADPPAAFLTVAVAPPKGDRFTDVVRGLTELGVGAIRPLICQRGERLPSSFDRVARVAAEAVKQCRRGRLPVFQPALDVAALAALGESLVTLDPAGLPAQPGKPRPVTLVIGPEGGLTAAETDLLTAAGAARARIATPILRIETAALAATAVWASAWEHP